MKYFHFSSFSFYATNPLLNLNLKFSMCEEVRIFTTPWLMSKAVKFDDLIALEFSNSLPYFRNVKVLHFVWSELFRTWPWNFFSEILLSSCAILDFDNHILILCSIFLFPKFLCFLWFLWHLSINRSRNTHSARDRGHINTKMVTYWWLLFCCKIVWFPNICLHLFKHCY